MNSLNSPDLTISVRTRFSFSRTAGGVLDGARNPTTDGNSMSYRSEEHTSELQSLMRISYAVFCLKKKKKALTNTYRSTDTLSMREEDKHCNTRTTLHN